jgi:hypothetical protein
MDGIEIMVAKLITLPRTLLVAGVLAMAPAAFAFAQTATPTPTTSTSATIGASTAAPASPASASPAKVTVKQDATVKAPDTKLDSQAAATTSKSDLKPVAKAETGAKKVKSVKKEAKEPVKTPVKAETKVDAKTDVKSPAAPATPAVQPKS